MRSTPSRVVIDVLLVEDDPGDVLMTREAFEEQQGPQHAARRQRRRARRWPSCAARASYADAPRPDLILLDLNLPRKDGREVLAEIKADADLRSIPVVVLTTSEAEEDVLRSYDLHANAYVTKPVDFDQFIKVVQPDRRLLRHGRETSKSRSTFLSLTAT